MQVFRAGGAETQPAGCTELQERVELDADLFRRDAAAHSQCRRRSAFPRHQDAANAWRFFPRAAVNGRLADAGCLFAGAIDVPIYPTLTPAQVRYILNDSGARVLFVCRRGQV